MFGFRNSVAMAMLQETAANITNASHSLTVLFITAPQLP